MTHLAPAAASPVSARRLQHSRSVETVETFELAGGSLDTPVGPLSVRVSATGVAEVGFAHEVAVPRAAEATASKATRALLADTLRQLAEYLRGRRRSFDLPLAPAPTRFQSEVRRALLGVPYGETVSYGELAARIGRPTATRAVGGANHQNPIGVIVPCHRVIGRDGTLTGYGGGLERKAWLLAHEARYRD